MEFKPSDTENIENSIANILLFIGDDPKREGLKDTPERVRKSWSKLFGGYKMNAIEILSRVFTDGSCDEMVILKDIEFYSTCEHHFLPFFGKISIGYIPNGKVVGVSKLARVVECFARRLQIQEKMTTQIADSIQQALEPEGVIVVCEAQHFCMTARGVEKKNSIMVTSAIRGVFNQNEVRAEFLQLIKV